MDEELVKLKIRTYLESNGYHSYLLKSVPSNYYKLTLEQRSHLLSAPSTAYLCKSMLMENTAYDPQYASPYYPQYLCVIIQYITKINTEKLIKWARELNKKANLVAPKSKFNFRLMPEDLSYAISGYQYNSVTPFCMNKNIPVLISDQCKGQFFWMGGGHVDLKLRMSVQEFIDKYPESVYFYDVVQPNN